MRRTLWQDWMDRIAQRVALRRWRQVADRAGGADLGELRLQRDQARSLRRHLDRLIHTADGRLALPAVGNQGIVRPADADWAWRPEVWCGPLATRGLASVDSKTRLGTELALFHDCRDPEITLRQIRNTSREDVAAFGLRLDVFRFDGSFLSMALDLPDDALAGLTPEHLLTLGARTTFEHPLEVFARLNVKCGPNTRQIVRELPAPTDDQQGESTVTFDLAYGNLGGRVVERMWLDLIFEAPQMNQITLRDLTLTRRRRAAL